MKKVIFLTHTTHDQATNDISSALVYWYGVLENMGYEVVYSDYREYNAESFYLSAKAYKPDFIIATNYFDSTYEEFNKLREFTKVYLLTGDIYRFYDSHVQHQINNVDGVIHFEEEQKPNEKLLKMRWAFNPNTMTSDSISPNKSNILHYGGLHGGRAQSIKELMSKGVNVKVLPSNLMYEQVKEEQLNSKYSLCFTHNAIRSRQEVKGRIIEIPNYTVLLTEPAPCLDLYFNESEIIIFNSIDEAKAKIDYYNSNPKEYNKLFHNGKRALWNRNTCYHEWDKILPFIDKDYKPKDIIKLLKTKHGKYYYE
jgi:hypothetical protein